MKKGCLPIPSISNHREKFYGNVVDWRNSTWETWNMRVVENVSYDEICRSRVPGKTVFPDGMSFDEANMRCKKLKSTMTVVESKEDQTEMIQKFKE